MSLLRLTRLTAVRSALATTLSGSRPISSVAGGNVRFRNVLSSQTSRFSPSLSRYSSSAAAAASTPEPAETPAAAQATPAPESAQAAATPAPESAEAPAAAQERPTPAEAQEQKPFPDLIPSTVQLGSFRPIAPQDPPPNPKKAPLFETVKDRIDKETYKAITVRPHKHTHMSLVQAAVLPLLPGLASPHQRQDPERKDLLVKAKTGTGKTLAFLVPAMEARLKAIEEAGAERVRLSKKAQDKQLDLMGQKEYAKNTVGALILSPTRELATQIANEAIKLATFHKGFEVRLFVGGSNKGKQLQEFKRGRADIVVATPGRMLDVLESSGMVSDAMKSAQTLILDEADTLLEMGFKDDMQAIQEYLPPAPERQTFLFSATVSPQIRTVARQTLKRDHLFIDCVPEGESNSHEHIPQYSSILSSPSLQIPHVLRLIAHDQLTNPSASKTIVFCPTTKMTMLYATILRAMATHLPMGRDAPIYEIHSKRSQEQRTRTSDQFRSDKSGGSVLVTSDVSARGVDYPGVTRVIQIGIPGSADQYVHRIGRTGRAGTTGRADIVLSHWEAGFLTWQLKNMPIKDAPANTLVEEVTRLAQEVDTLGKTSDRPPVDPRISGRKGLPRPAPRVNVGYRTDVAARLEEIPQAYKTLTRQLDEEAVRETFASLLGYYIAKFGEIRTTKTVIVEGIKEWTTAGMGLDRPPYVSDAFLQKLGFTDNRTRRFGARDRYGGRDTERYMAPSHMGESAFARREDQRGGFRGPDRGKTRDEWAKRGMYGYRGQGPPPRDDLQELDAEEYRGARYGRDQDAPEERAMRGGYSGGRGGFGGSGGFGGGSRSFERRGPASGGAFGQRRSYSTTARRSGFRLKESFNSRPTRSGFTPRAESAEEAPTRTEPVRVTRCEGEDQDAYEQRCDAEREGRVAAVKKPGRVELHPLSFYRHEAKIARRRKWAAYDAQKRMEAIRREL